MNLSAKVDYACRVLAQLAGVSSSNALLHIEELAKAEAIPSNYLAQILNDLRHGGLTTSRRGKAGGYGLAREADLITLYDIVKAVEGDIMSLSGSPAGESGSQVHAIWAEVQNYMESKYKEYTVKSITTGVGEGMYYI